MKKITVSTSRDFTPDDTVVETYITYAFGSIADLLRSLHEDDPTATVSSLVLVSEPA